MDHWHNNPDLWKLKSKASSLDHALGEDHNDEKPPSSSQSDSLAQPADAVSQVVDGARTDDVSQVPHGSSNPLVIDDMVDHNASVANDEHASVINPDQCILPDDSTSAHVAPLIPLKIINRDGNKQALHNGSHLVLNVGSSVVTNNAVGQRSGDFEAHYTCNICTAELGSPANAQYHACVHAKVKVHACLCRKSYFSHSDLKRHIKKKVEDGLTLHGIASSLVCTEHKAKANAALEEYMSLIC